jgi:hypothetical protein
MPGQVREFVQAHGRELDKQYVECLEAGPERDLRDVLLPSRQGGLAVCSEVRVVDDSEISGPL